MKEYQFHAIIQQNGDMDASYIIFPYDLRAEFGKVTKAIRKQIGKTFGDEIEVSITER